MQRRPVVRPLGGAEVSVAVRGPSPGEGGGKNQPDVLVGTNRRHDERSKNHLKIPFKNHLKTI